MSAAKLCFISVHGYFNERPDLGLPDTGGQISYVLELAKACAINGQPVDILTRAVDGVPSSNSISDGVRLIRIPFGPLGFVPKEVMYRYRTEAVRSILRWIHRDKPQYKAIFTHYWDAGLIGTELADVMNIAHWFTPHSLGAWKHSSSRNTPFSETYTKTIEVRIEAEKYISLKSHRVIATSKKQSDLITEYFGIERTSIRTVTPGFDSNRFFFNTHDDRLRARSEFGIAKDEFLVTFLGRVAANKGLVRLVEEFGIFMRSAPNARLVLPIQRDNAAWEEESVLEMIQSAIDQSPAKSQIELLGRISEASLPSFLATADAFVLPSTYEPFGMAALEAIAVGTPTIVSSLAGIAEVLNNEEHALVANVLQDGSVANCLATLMRNKVVRDRVSRVGSELVRRRFSWSAVAFQFLDLVGAEC